PRVFAERSTGFPTDALRLRVEGDTRPGSHRMTGGGCGAILAAVWTQGDAARQETPSLSEKDELLHSFLTSTPPTSGARASRLTGPCQSLTTPSSPALAMVAPSGEKATEFAPPACPVSTIRSWPVARSHKLMLPSRFVEARIFPSGWKAMET